MYTLSINGVLLRNLHAFALLVSGLFLAPLQLVAQAVPTGDALEEIILKNDSLFWVAYNTCDVAAMSSYVAEDLEFYHDKGGQSNGRATFAELMENGLCRSGNNEIERRPVAETIQVFPIAGVGAILRGQHTFHGVKNPNDNGIAFFFHLWTLRDERWVMTRVFSYDHLPLLPEGGPEAIELPQADLKKFAGQYQAPRTGSISIKATDTGISLNNGNESLDLLPSSPTSFFSNKLPLVFEFSLDERGNVTGFSVIEQGQKVEEAKKL